MINARKTTEQFIQQAIAKHGDKYNYNLVNYINLKTKVIITCPKHGNFSQTPHDHLKPIPRGCPDCGNRKKMNTESFIEKATGVHADTYDYSLVEYMGAKSKVKIICKEHGEFLQVANSHISGHRMQKMHSYRIAKCRTLCTKIKAGSWRYL